MNYVSICVLVVVLFRVRSETSIRSDLDENQRKVASIDGDYVIGALFPIHQKPDQSTMSADKIVCGDIREQYGMQRVEAALWTVKQINKWVTILSPMCLITICLHLYGVISGRKF